MQNCDSNQKPNLTFERDWLRQPLNLTLGAMRSLPIFSVSPVAVFAAGLPASSGVVVARFVVALLELPVRLFLRAAGFSVSRSSLLRPLLRLALPIFRAAVLRRFLYCATLPWERLTLHSRGTGYASPSI